MCNQITKLSKGRLLQLTTKSQMYSIYFKKIFTKEDNANIPRVDPIENVPLMTDIAVTGDDVINKILALRKSKSPI